MMQTEMRWYNLLAYVLITLQFILLMFLAMNIHNLRIDYSKLEQDNQKIRQELIETEAKCQRLTDQCIYILAEGVWE